MSLLFFDYLRSMMYTRFRGIHATTVDAVIGCVAGAITIFILAWILWTLYQGGWHVAPERIATVCHLTEAGDVYLVGTADGQQYMLAEEVRVRDEPVSAQRAFDELQIGSSYVFEVTMVPWVDWNETLKGIGQQYSSEARCPA